MGDAEEKIGACVVRSPRGSGMKGNGLFVRRRTARPQFDSGRRIPDVTDRSSLGVDHRQCVESAGKVNDFVNNAGVTSYEGFGDLAPGSGTG
ncbi:hypothetical protein [Paenarthrobacter nicotinovorans]|uniref:hypothetical protein n=1 Tax=Paenarthrobacter TaxID=1742992 RepID=UPI003D67D892